jgi:hypothetical protein
VPGAGRPAGWTGGSAPGLRPAAADQRRPEPGAPRVRFL